MKAVVLTIGFVFAVGAAAFAGNGESLVDKIMHRKISYPEALRAKGIEATVTVQVRVVSENCLEIVSIDSENGEMTEAVKKQIERMKVTIPTSMIGQLYTYAFKFKVQK